MVSTTASVLRCWLLAAVVVAVMAGYSDEDKHGGDDHGHKEAKPYNFVYKVSGDDKKDGKLNFGHGEKSDGHKTTGQYKVDLPDGRTQIVSYHVDKDSGFQADVKFIGEAKHPEGKDGDSKGDYSHHQHHEGDDDDDDHYEAEESKTNTDHHPRGEESAAAQQYGSYKGYNLRPRRR